MISISNDSPSSSSENQSLTEVIIRLAATHIFGVCLYGHFGTLANVPSRVHVIHVLAFLLHPRLIAGQIFLGVIRAVRYYYHDRRRDNPQRAGLQFYLDGILGVRAKQSPPRDNTNNVILGLPPDQEEPSANPLPLFRIDYYRLRRVTSPDPLSWVWFGRLFVCLFLVTQAIGTCVIFIRRQKHGCGLSIDLAPGMMAFSSAITGIAVLYLHVIRTVWVISNDPSPNSATSIKHLQREGSYLIDDLFTCILISEVIILPIGGSMILPFLGYPSPLVVYDPSVIISWLTYSLLLFGNTYANLRVSGFPSSKTRILSVRFLIRGLGVSLISVLIQEFWVISIQDLFTTKEGCWKDPLSDILFVI